MSSAVSRAVQVRRRSRARQVRNIMATAAPAPPRVESVPVSREEEIDDDFVLIELVLDGKNRGKSKPPSGEEASKNQKTVPATTSVVPTNLEEYEDFVELTIEDANLPESRSEDSKRSLYGVRLFQYSPESEGNIYITNEEL